MAMNTTTRQDYHKRINQVMVYINSHLDEKLELETLAAISNFSPYHFHRIIRAHLNESIGSYINRIRMETAANFILHTGEPIFEIALRVGYDIPSSFNKAFSKRFGCAPTEFRNNHNAFNTINYFKMENVKNELGLKPAFKTLKPAKVIFVQTIGDYNSIGTSKAWEKVCAFAEKNKLFGWKTEFIGISHDDPDITETEKLRYDACITITKDIKPEGVIGVQQIEGGKYAVFLHKGPYEKLHETYDKIFAHWLPGSNFELRNTPCFEKYLNEPERTKPEKLKTEIYLPVQ
jgi:AraC family transcriptional regulator